MKNNLFNKVNNMFIKLCINIIKYIIIFFFNIFNERSICNFCFINKMINYYNNLIKWCLLLLKHHSTNIFS